MIEKKIDKMQISFSHRQINCGFSWVIQKGVEMFCLVHKNHVLMHNAWCNIINIAKFH